MQTFERELLAAEGNFAGLARLHRELIGKVEGLDMDPTEIPVCGEQEQSAYNGHFETTCYHPMLLFNGGDDCLAAKLVDCDGIQSRESWETAGSAQRIGN